MSVWDRKGSKMKYTLGPWKAEKPPHNLRSGLRDKNPDAILIISHGTVWGFGVDVAALGGGEESEANAILISLAPEMVDVLKLMVERFSHYVHEPIPPIQPGCQADDEWIAIQKACNLLNRLEEEDANGNS